MRWFACRGPRGFGILRRDRRRMRWRGARLRLGRSLGLWRLAGRCGILWTFWVPPELDECGCVGANSRSLRPQNQQQRLPGSMNLNRALQVPRQRQRRPPEGGRYKFNGNALVATVAPHSLKAMPRKGARRCDSRTPIRRLVFPGEGASNGERCFILARGTGYQRIGWRTTIRLGRMGHEGHMRFDRARAGLPGGVTFVGTDGLLWRAEGYGRMGEVEHVYISLHSRDLHGSDDSVRRV